MSAANDLAQEANARIGAILLGKWRIVRLIGVGGMGAVYEARHSNENRVAVKVMHQRAALSKAQLARFKQEGLAANRVKHPGVVEIFDEDVDAEGSPFLVMELLSGRTAEELARDHGGKLPVDRVLELAEQVLDVLAAAHANGILHRDIKPENLFITDEGKLKVLDFGIARLSDPGPGTLRTIDGTLLGTPAFSPPEQARGRVDEMDERSDVWAVGATMFTLLSGRLVHSAETTNEQLGLAMSVDAPSLAAVDPALPTAVVAVVDRALAYDRADRWPSARTMQEAVRSARDAAKNQAPPPGFRPRLRAAIVACAGLAVAGFVTASHRSTKHVTATRRPVPPEMRVAAPASPAAATAIDRSPASESPPVSQSLLDEVARRKPTAGKTAPPVSHPMAAPTTSVSVTAALVTPAQIGAPASAPVNAPKAAPNPLDRRH